MGGKVITRRLWFVVPDVIPGQTKDIPFQAFKRVKVSRHRSYKFFPDTKNSDGLMSVEATPLGCVICPSCKTGDGKFSNCIYQDIRGNAVVEFPVRLDLAKIAAAKKRKSKAKAKKRKLSSVKKGRPAKKPKLSKSKAKKAVPSK